MEDNYTNEVNLISKIGKIIPALLTSSNITIGGRTLRQGIFKDITERKKAEQELLEEKKFTEMAINSQRDTFFIFEPSTGKAIRWNKSFREISGYSDDEIAIMKAPNSYYKADDLKRAIIAVDTIIKDKSALVEMSLITKNGESIPFEYLGSGIFDEEGSLKYIVSIGRNVTERKEAERQILNLAKFPSENPNPVLRVTKDRVIYANLASQELFHTSKGEIIPKLLQESVNKVITENLAKNLEVSLQDQVYSLDITPIKDENYVNIYGKNITARKAIEKKYLNLNIELEQKVIERTRELKETEEKYRSLFETSPYMIALIDSNGKILDFNSATLDYLELKKKEIVGKDFRTLEFIQGENLKKLNAIYKDLYKKGNSEPVEIEIIKNDKRKLWLNIQTSVVKVSDETNIQVIIQDITEKKKAELRIKESEEKYRHLFEHSPFSIVLIDMFGKIVDVNQFQVNLFGYDKKDLINKTFTEISVFKEKDISSVISNFKQLVKGLVPDPQEYLITRKDGSQVWGLIQASRVNLGGKTYIQLITQDINKRKLAEEKFRTIIQDLDIGYFNIGMDGKLIFHNPAFNMLVGYDPSENLIGTQAMDFWYNPKERENYMAQVLNEGKIENFVACMKTKNGETIFVELNSRVVKDENRNPIGIEGTLVDITEKLEYEQKLKEEAIRLREINEYKTNLLNRTSHELQTPLISIKGFTDILLTKYEDILDTDMVNYLEIINKSANRLVKTIRSMIDTAYLEKEIFKINVYTEDLAFLIRTCIKNYRRLMKLRKQSVVLNIQDILITKFDKKKIYRVFESIIDNAFNNTATGGKIEIQSEIKADKIIVSIKDNGIGLTKEEQKQIFQPFGKIERYGQGVDLIIEGPGLSLYICKKIIELHGGEIWVASKGRNKGSVFYFSLPLLSD